MFLPGCQYCIRGTKKKFMSHIFNDNNNKNFRAGNSRMIII